MPAKSGKQYRLMAGIAHGMKPNKGIGPSPEVAKKIIEGTSKDDRKMFMGEKSNSDSKKKKKSMFMK